MATEEVGNDVRIYAESSSAQSESASMGISDLDGFGNTALHQCFGHGDSRMQSFGTVLHNYPEYAATKNQFGRIPLHYALDRIKVHKDNLKLLIQTYPEGVNVRDNENKTPYDLAIKWKHSNSIKKLLLDVDPDMDPDMYFKLKWGVLATMYNWLFFREPEPKRSRIFSDIFQASAPNTYEASNSSGVPSPTHATHVTLYDSSSSEALNSALRRRTTSTSDTIRGDISEQNSNGAMLSANNSMKRLTLNEDSCVREDAEYDDYS